MADIIKNVYSLFHNNSYSDIFPQINILNSREHNIFLECYTYDLIVIVADSNKKKSLNIFEETVLRFLKYKKCSDKEIAETLCMSEDLINFIIIKLEEDNLINNRRNITNLGEKMLSGNFEGSSDIEERKRKCKLFVNKDTNRILPYIHIGRVVYDEAIYNKGSFIEVNNMDMGENNTYKGMYLHSKTYEKPVERFDQVELRNVFKLYNRICEANKLYEPIKLDNKYAIDISREEDVLFHFQAFVQDGNVDNIIVSDGFVLNIDFLANEITKCYVNKVNDIKKDAGKYFLEEESKNVMIASTKYSQLQVLLRNDSEKNNTIDELKNINQKNKQKLLNCFLAIEWAFHYQLKNYPLSEEMILTMQSQTAKNNKSLIKKMLNELGVKYLKKDQGLFSNISSGRIRIYYETYEPVLYTVLPLVIASAYENSNNTFHNLASKMPNFLNFISYMNHIGKKLRHDSSAKIHIKNIDSLYDRTKMLIELLLPNFYGYKYKKDDKKELSISHKRVNAQVSLCDEMGSVFFYSLSEDIKEELIKISPDKNEKEIPRANEYILILCRILESYLSKTIKDLNINKNDSKQDALSKINKFYKNKLPKSIVKVKENFFNNAKKGYSASLGAYCIVVSAYCEDKAKEGLNKEGFIDFIGEIVELRSHGNNTISLSMEYEDLNLLRKKTISVIKVLGGYYG